MKVIGVLLVCMLCLVAPVKAEFTWQNVGGEPNVCDTYTSLDDLGLNSQDFPKIMWNTRPESVWIQRGDRFSAMNFGNHKVRTDVVVGFDRTRAEMWEIPSIANVCLYRVDECGNWAYNVRYVPLRDAEALQKLIEEIVEERLAEKKSYPDWLIPWLVALTLIALWALFERHQPGPQGAPGKDGQDGKPGPKGDRGPAGFCRCAKPELEKELQELSGKLAGKDAKTLAKVMPDLAEATRLINDPNSFEEVRIRELLAGVKTQLS